MMDKPTRNIIYFFAAILCLHMAAAAYAILDGGYMIYGLTAPERFLIHYLTFDESHITVSGAQKHIIKDICFMESKDSPLVCFRPESVFLSCEDDCIIRSRGGKTLAKDGQLFHAVYMNALLRYSVTLRCIDDICAFEQIFEDGSVYTSYLTESIIY